MFKPDFDLTSTLVPVLSRNQIEQIAIEILRDYNSALLEHPQPLDIDRFLEQYLGATIEYKRLSSSRIYLGMTVFADCSGVPVFNTETHQAECIRCKARTVLLDTSLLSENQQHRYSFTGAHEAAHLILHGAYFRKRLETAVNQPKVILCQDESRRTGKTCRTDEEWLEWQADHLASSLLMPLPAVQLAIARAKHRSLSVNYAQEAIMTAFDVSCAAGGNRYSELQQADLLNPFAMPDEEDLPF